PGASRGTPGRGRPGRGRGVGGRSASRRRAAPAGRATGLPRRTERAGPEGRFVAWVRSPKREGGGGASPQKAAAWGRQAVGTFVCLQVRGSGKACQTFPGARPDSGKRRRSTGRRTPPF